MKLIRTKTSARTRPGFASSNEVSLSDLAQDEEFVATANTMLKVFGKTKPFKLSGAIRPNQEPKLSSYGKFRLVYRGLDAGVSVEAQALSADSPYRWPTSLASMHSASATPGTSDLELTPDPQGAL